MSVRATSILGRIVATAALKKLQSWAFLWSSQHFSLIRDKSSKGQHLSIYTDALKLSQICTDDGKKKSDWSALSGTDQPCEFCLFVFCFCFFKKMFLPHWNWLYRLSEINPVYLGKVPSGSSWGGERKSLVCGEEFVYRPFGHAAFAISCLCYGPPCYATSQIKVIITANSSRDNIYHRSQSQSPSGLQFPLSIALVFSPVRLLALWGWFRFSAASEVPSISTRPFDRLQGRSYTCVSSS